MESNRHTISMTEQEINIVLDSLSNTIFNEEIKEETRKTTKTLYMKLQKQFPHLK